MNSFEKEKQEVEVSLARIIYTQLDQKTTPYEEARRIAQFILLRIDEIKEQNQLLSLLEDLSAKWEIFNSLRDLYKLKITDVSTTNQKLEEVKNNLSQIK